jgi:cyanophycin synthetase
MIPATMAGRHDGKVWNALFAVAIARAMGAPPDRIRHGLSSFKPDMADSQGRFSVIDRHPFRVILDHGFSPEAMAQLASTVRKMPVTGRRLAYVMASGRMRDELIRAFARALAGAFDHYVCTNWDARPGKERHTVPDLLRDAIVGGGVPADAVVCIPGEEEAMRYILGVAGPGDVVVMNTAETDRAVAMIESFGADGAGAAMALSQARTS